MAPAPAPAPALTTHQIITSSEDPNWRTPQWLYDALDREFGFVLDAAADNDSTKAAFFLGPGSSLLEDGLLDVPWWQIVQSYYSADRAGGVPLSARAIFLNPPYSRKQGMAIDPWVARAAREGMSGTVVAVLPYSPQTRWWRSYVETEDPRYRATEVRRFPFRLAFEPAPTYTPKGNGRASGANINNAVVIWRAANGFIEPWIPAVRYWTPAEYAARPRGRGDVPAAGDESADGTGEGGD